MFQRRNFVFGGEKFTTRPVSGTKTTKSIDHILPNYLQQATEAIPTGEEGRDVDRFELRAATCPN